MNDDRLPAEVELAWDGFHRAVNMTADELAAWLAARDADGRPAADPDGADLGRAVTQLLGKRKVDLTDEDADVMLTVADFVTGRTAHPPPAGADDEPWRRSLMTVGHDPRRA